MQVLKDFLIKDNKIVTQGIIFQGKNLTSVRNVGSRSATPLITKFMFDSTPGTGPTSVGCVMKPSDNCTPSKLIRANTQEKR